jgi:hypothetical protein
LVAGSLTAIGAIGGTALRGVEHVVAVACRTGDVRARRDATAGHRGDEGRVSVVTEAVGAVDPARTLDDVAAILAVLERRVDSALLIGVVKGAGLAVDPRTSTTGSGRSVVGLVIVVRRVDRILRVVKPVARGLLGVTVRDRRSVFGVVRRGVLRRRHGVVVTLGQFCSRVSTATRCCRRTKSTNPLRRAATHKGIRRRRTGTAG